MPGTQEEPDSYFFPLGPCEALTAERENEKGVGGHPRQWGVYWLKNPLSLTYSEKEKNHIGLYSEGTRAQDCPGTPL